MGANKDRTNNNRVDETTKSVFSFLSFGAYMFLILDEREKEKSHSSAFWGTVNNDIANVPLLLLLLLLLLV
jgi:hypothetical protein